jgi:hypothetical protein
MTQVAKTSKERLPERIFVWGLVESIESLEGAADQDRQLYSIDALATDDSGHFRKIGPEDVLHIRRIVFAYAQGDTQHTVSRKLFESMKEGQWVRLRVAGTGQGPECEIEGPFRGLAPDHIDTADPDAPVFIGRLRWGRMANSKEERRLDRLCTVEMIKPASVIGRPGVALPGSIRVLDAGQAHCAEIHGNGTPSKVLGYFDVGRPISFSASSWPNPPPILDIPDAGFVILSHWDYDHYSMALSFAPSLLNLNWLAPMPAKSSPTVAALVKKLGSSLVFATDPVLSPHAGISLHKGLGPKSDRNSSGYVMRVSLPSGDVLLAGDVDYQYIPTIACVGLSGLLAPHHGGKLVGQPPVPHGIKGRAVFSFGSPNTYGHPHATSIVAHVSKGWMLAATNWSSEPKLAPSGVAGHINRLDYWFQ